MATGASDTGHRAVGFAAALSKEFGQALCIRHMLMRGRPAGEITKMVDVEGLAKPARNNPVPERLSRQSTQTESQFGTCGAYRFFDTFRFRRMG
jgi:hypothetical protein